MLLVTQSNWADVGGSVRNEMDAQLIRSRVRVSKHQHYPLVGGNELVSALQAMIEQRSTYMVKWICDGRHPPQISAAKALKVVRKNAGTYMGKVSGTRVYHIIEVDPRAHPCSAFDPQYLKDRAVMRFHADQRSSIPEEIRRRDRVEMWDRVLATAQGANWKKT